MQQLLFSALCRHSPKNARVLSRIGEWSMVKYHYSHKAGGDFDGEKIF